MNCVRLRRALGAAALAAGTLAAAATAAVAGEVPNALIVLEADPATPGSDPAAAPPRFALLKDGQVFVGGTSRLDAGRLEKGEAQALRRGADAVRKAAGKAAALSLGGDERHVVRLRLPEDEPREITITGDPAAAPPALQAAAAYLRQLLAFDHPGLAPYVPAGYALAAREGRLAGGCRSWRFPFAIADALAAPRLVAATDAEGWPTGGWPASVCAGDKRYVVTLRPLLPGEQP
jgi:hypothetical protein